MIHLMTHIRFSGRELEWFLVGITLMIGAWLFFPPPSMDSPAYSILLAWGSETLWARVFGVVGTAHFIALAINGRAPWTPYVRAVCSALNWLAYISFAVGFALLDAASTAVPTYGALSLMGLLVFTRAVKDCTVMSRTRARNERTG